MSLVFKIMKSATTFHGVDYNEQKQEKGTAKNIYYENFGYLQDRTVVTKDQFKKYLEDYSGRNSRVTNPQFHAVLSCKGSEYSFEQLKNYTIEMMQRLGYGDNPLLIYEHHDTKNHHVHIVTTRVGPDGKKVNHNLEAKRANQLLNELLKIDPKQILQNNLDAALLFNFTTVPQFLLLMEQKGYKQKVEGTEILFYRHGTIQGRLRTQTIEQRIQNSSFDRNRTVQIKALLQEYKQHYSTHLVLQKNPNIHTAIKPKYESELTSQMNKKFGLEFVFFAAKGKPPYGYNVIDYKSGSIYKGSDLMPLSELQMQTPVQKGTDQAFGLLPDHTPRLEHQEPSLLSPLGNIIEQGLRDVEADSHHLPRKKPHFKQRY